jgi:DICT domain-containing protein
VTHGQLSTAQLAERTGVSPGTLRAWESRHGFPSPGRLSSGHRRYTEHDVEAVNEVVRLRAEGLSMPSAIRWAAGSPRPPTASIFAGLRFAQPDLAPIVLSKRALLALTRAIEDEYCARGAGGLLVGSFQRERFYRGAEPRWTVVARGAQLAIALADFQQLRTPGDGVVEVPVAPKQPLAREWTLIVDASAIRACLAAWELPSSGVDRDWDRRFEVVWSFEPQAVRCASEAAVEVLRRTAPAIADRALAALTDTAGRAGPQLRSASVLAQRVVGYLGCVHGLEPGAD